MAVAPAQFNVVFGFNQTPLTEALESRNFNHALGIIESRSGSCLDEGYYRRIPLYIVLSGENSCFDGKVLPVHLKIARLLIEKGADPMLRIPEFLGAEYIGPGRSPLECIVDLYNSITSYGTSSNDTMPPFPVILLNGKKCSSTKALADDLISLVWMLLGHGAEVNVLDIENKTPLHNTLLRSADLQMAQVLCDNGANVSATDRCGNTPLMSLCSPMPWRTYNEYGPCASGYSISKAVHYLLRFESVKINHCGIHGRTALFNAMQSGNFEVAQMLLIRGANPDIKGMGPDGRYISPLLAAIIPWRAWGRFDVKSNVKAIGSLIDSGYFSTDKILKELMDYTIDKDSDDASLLKLFHKGKGLIQLLFGKRSCPLTQLAARTAVEHKFPGLEFSSFATHDIIKFVRREGLPLELISHFEIVLLRDKILNALAETDWDIWDMEQYFLDEIDSDNSIDDGWGQDDDSDDSSDESVDYDDNAGVADVDEDGNNVDNGNWW
ncbi:uncharacterized protein LOC110251807 [Exaiptasia diaphana]|uniref:Ankyrin n=1 Tax=Exaiptasia diaphana TaxID=2652724 RepID=A0A913Y4A8_EXADI|nr:uncharacterized protein LOC110251807 [Exaiptasia diaphana]KXJ22774.1 Protein fem-1-like C [Exaiptasia diaphana]